MGIANIINTAGGGGGGGSEIITNLVNSVDGAGLRLANQGYISCADVSSNRFGTNDFSVEFVLSQETNSINADIFISNLNSSNQAVDAAVIRWDVIQNDNIQLVFTNSGATETAYNFGYDPAPDLNEPTHYLVSADRSGNAVLYRNGAEIASVSIAASGSANVGNSGEPTVIGSPVNNFGFKGNVYRLRTYSKALSSDEAKNVFDRADVPTALVSNLLLDLDCAYANPTQSTVIQDRGPNNQDGTLNGTITQTNVIKQLNSTSARIGTTVATPADGELLASGNIGSGSADPNINGWGNAITIDNSGTAALEFAKSGTLYGFVGVQGSGSGNAFDVAAFQSQDMRFKVGSNAGTIALTIDSSGNVSIAGAADPYSLSGDGAVNQLSVHATGTNKSASLNLASTGTGWNGVSLGNETIRRAFVGTLNGSHLVFYTNNSNSGTTVTERMRIASTGQVQIQQDASDQSGASALKVTGMAYGTNKTIEAYMSTGSAIKSLIYAENASGAVMNVRGDGLAVFSGGINLGDTTLSNYAEGTWTPTLPNGGSLTTNSATYTRIGNICHLQFFVTSIAPTADTSRFEIGGLPFTVSDVANYFPAGSIGFAGDGQFANYRLVGNNNTTTCYFHTVAGSTSTLTNNDFISQFSGVSDALVCSITYRVK